MVNFDSTKADDAINTARLAYAEASLDQFEEYQTPEGKQFWINGQSVYKYKEKLEGYDIFVIELDRETKRKILEEYFNTRQGNFTTEVQNYFANPEQAKNIISLLNLQASNNQEEKSFCLIGPSLETNFRLD